MPNPITVAVVEDDTDTRTRIVQSIHADDELELIGEYKNAADTLQGLARLVPDVMLVDLGLPDMPGLELIRLAAASYPACDILVFTTFADDATVLAALEAGAKGYLLKGSLQHPLGLDIRDIKAGGSPLSPVIARHLLRRMAPSFPTAGHAFPSALTVSDDTQSGNNGNVDIVNPLSPREREILVAISRGFTYSETAKIMGIAPTTVHTHLKHVYRKLEVSSKTEAIFEASKMGLL